jgi:hypothetical protein
MSTIVIVLVAILIVGAGVGIFALVAPRRAESKARTRHGPPLQATTDWTNEVGDEFAGLSESARCDMIFAVAALEDERSNRLLMHALNDPAEAVSLAAAHALAGNGRRLVVDQYLTANPGQRADRIAQALALLE